MYSEWVQGDAGLTRKGAYYTAIILHKKWIKIVRQTLRSELHPWKQSYKAVVFYKEITDSTVL